VPLSCVLSAGHWRWIIRAEFRFVYVCAGLAAIDVPAATIPNTATISERTSVSSLLEVVSEDLLKLNNNLKSVSFLLFYCHMHPFCYVHSKCSGKIAFMILLVLVHL
jgi:all-trans-nonaprenyl-diphosphate synthase